jgi:hypothetical protein
MSMSSVLMDKWRRVISNLNERLDGYHCILFGEAVACEGLPFGYLWGWLSNLADWVEFSNAPHQPFGSRVRAIANMLHR